MPGIGYGPQAANYTTARPTADTIVSSLNTFFKDCTSAAAKDGTVVDASWLNMVTAQIRTAIANASITLDDTNDNQLWLAMQKAAVSAGVMFTAAAAAPTTPKLADIWFDTTVGTINIYATDGTTFSWIQI